MPEAPVILVLVGMMGLLVVGAVVVGTFWLLDRLIGRRGDRAARTLARRLERGEITPDEYRAGIDAIEGRAGSGRDG
jgi:uncharacterized membrane protein